MTWLIWALLSAFFAGLTAILAEIGVQDINSNPATGKIPNVVSGISIRS